MKPDYTANIDAILAGSPINVQAKLLGVNVNTLRRLLIQHPDYEKAKAEGRLHSKGIAVPKLRDAAKDSPAVAEVMAGATTTSVAEKYGIPVTSLTKMVHLAHPGVSLRYRGVSEVELAERAYQKAQKALARAQARITATM